MSIADLQERPCCVPPSLARSSFASSVTHLVPDADDGPPNEHDRRLSCPQRRTEGSWGSLRRRLTGKPPIRGAQKSGCGRAPSDIRVHMSC